ncbi:MAG: HAMP domain-containing sensor histidine kinase [bacterium]|nr:HAMP domain-containing sensor histidine kinase [bacterium]
MKFRWNPFSFRHSLRAKFSLITTAIFLVIFGLVSFVLIRQNVNFQKQSLLSRANTFSNLATKPIGDSYKFYFESGFLRFREQLIDTLILNEDVIRLQIISVEGEILFDTINLDRQIRIVNKIEDPKVLQAVSANHPTQLTGKSGDVSEIIVPYSDDFGARPFSARYFISYDSIYESINDTIITIGFLTLVVLILTLVSMIALVNASVLSPLGKIVGAAREISRGNLQKKIESKTNDELEDLATSLNQMTATLRKNIEDLSQLDKLKDEFVYLASHNLRTPITIIKGYVGSLQKNKSIDNEAEKSLRKISESTHELEIMTNSLLNLVTLEKGKDQLLRRPVDLKKLLEEAAGKFTDKAADKKIGFILEFPKGQFPLVTLDQQRMIQALSGLIDNAIKFNREGGKVIIKLEEKKSQALVSIYDTGIGIPKEERARVFQKFHRATEVLTYNYTGIGLGLYLTKLIVEAHQGKIWFESEEGKGTTFYVVIPIKEEPLGG